MKCLMGIDTYLVLEKPNLFVSQVQLTHKGKSESYPVNEEHKIILRKLDKQRSEECDLTLHDWLPWIDDSPRFTGK